MAVGVAREVWTARDVSWSRGTAGDVGSSTGMVRAFKTRSATSHAEFLARAVETSGCEDDPEAAAETRVESVNRERQKEAGKSPGGKVGKRGRG